MTQTALNLTYSLRTICEQPSIHTYFDVIPESPDGEWICYFQFDGKPLNHGTIYICRLDGSEHKAIAQCHGTPHGAAQQGWLDNEHIYFSVDGNVHIAHISGEIIKTFPGAIDTIHQGSRIGIAPSKNLTRCGLETDSEACYRVDIDSGTLSKILDRQTAWGLVQAHLDTKELIEENVSFKHTKLSPNGKEWFVVFTTEEKMKGQPHTRVKSIIATNIDGSNPRYLGEFGHHPIWKPDGSAIFAFEHGSNTLLQWDPAGGPACELCTMSVAGHPSMHPRLPYVVTDVHRTDSQAIYLQNISTGTEQCIYEGSYPHVDWQTEQHPRHRICHAHPVWSADGRRLYFNHIAGDMPQLHVVAFNF